MKRTLNKIISSVLILPLVWMVLLSGSVPLMEGYNFITPFLDTEFAEDYSPIVFDKITKDQNLEVVTQLLGEPLYISHDTVDGEIQIGHSYTSDGFFESKGKFKGYSIEDFAWYRSIIIFNSKGEILGINKGWTYD